MVYQDTYNIEQILQKMQRYCAYQERCHQEVEHKLRSYPLTKNARDEILLKLLEDNFLNEERYAKAYVSGKFKIKKWGKNRLKAELKKRNISSYNIKNALSQIDQTTYEASFYQLALKRYKQLENIKAVSEKKKKFADYLFYRGWESQLVGDAIRKLFKP
ncbi:MAG: recombinase RecX [Flavobacteriales bacterium]|nr:MAG: recombinase RecX [Flavobacteriales bacterium]